MAQEHQESIEFLCSSYQSSALKNDHEFVSADVEPLNPREFTRATSNWLYQFGVILKRNLMVYSRIPATSVLKLVLPILMALLVSSMFSGLKEDYTGVRDRNGVLFFLTLSSSFLSLQFVVLVFPHERPIFLREVGNNMYSVSSYFFGRMFAELPMNIIVPIIYGSVVYFIIGLNQATWFKYPVFRKLSLALTSIQL